MRVSISELVSECPGVGPSKPPLRTYDSAIPESGIFPAYNCTGMLPSIPDQKARAPLKGGLEFLQKSLVFPLG